MKNIHCVLHYSMGGAIAVHTAQRGLVPSLIGLVVIDVVEGRYKLNNKCFLHKKYGFQKVNKL